MEGILAHYVKNGLTLSRIYTND